jgi:hypothetical protein
MTDDGFVFGLTELRTALSDMDIQTVNKLLLSYAVLPANAKKEMRLAEIERSILLFEYDAAIEVINALLRDGEEAGASASPQRDGAD